MKAIWFYIIITILSGGFCLMLALVIEFVAYWPRSAGAGLVLSPCVALFVPLLIAVIRNPPKRKE